MFTGIVSDIGTITAVERKEKASTVVIGTAYDTATIALGASIACAGVCLTVVAMGEDSFTVDISVETLGCTTLGTWQAGTKVNLERALCLGDELGGHMVSGHVDGVTSVLERTTVGENCRLTFALPEGAGQYIAAKGSVVIDGVSLTVNQVTAEGFTVNIIPHTLVHTTLGALQTGDKVNLEIDMVARYIARIMEYR